MEAPRLQIEGLRKSFDGVEAVRRLDLAVGAGEFISLLGPSGCGKSTTLAMVAGFLQPDEGRIVVDGKPVGGVPPHKRRIGLVFQDYAVFSRLTVRENLLFGLEAQRVARGERTARVDAMARRLDLTDSLHRRAASLNMSEMQRVALARVLVTQPKLLLLDEPMSNLDAAVRGALRGELKRIQKDLGQSVLYVTHDQVEAMSMSDRIAVMNGGELLQVGTPDEIYHHPANRFVAEFIGDPPINLIAAEVRASGGEVAVRTALLDWLPIGRGRLPAGDWLVAVRPHDLTLAPESPGLGPSGTVRFVENLGSEDVVHAAFAEELVAIVAEHGTVSVGDRVLVAMDGRKLHLIDRRSEMVVRLDGRAIAA